MLHRYASIATLLLCAPILLCLGCGGGGSGAQSTTSTTTSYDMGTLTTVGDTDGFTLTSSVSGMVLGISGQSQTAGTSVVQEAATTTTADIDWHFMPM